MKSESKDRKPVEIIFRKRIIKFTHVCSKCHEKPVQKPEQRLCDSCAYEAEKELR